MILNNMSLNRFIEKNNVKQLMLQAVKVDWVLCQLGGTIQPDLADVKLVVQGGEAIRAQTQ